MLLSEYEYRTLLEPLIRPEVAAELGPAERTEASAMVALSLLCEPGDRVPGFLLGADISAEGLVREICAGSSAASVAANFGPSVVQQLSDELETDWPSIWKAALERWKPRAIKTDLLDALEFMGNRGSGLSVPHRITFRGAADYPELLSDLGPGSPYALWMAGQTELLDSPSRVSIVGTRLASHYGREVTADLATVAAQSGITTVSGGAFGIDAVVHEVAAALGAPTVSVMAGGLANLYPRSNLSLFKSLVPNGVLISENVPTVVPAKWRFLARNRLIAALGQATILVEAGATSGATSTGRHAVGLGRTVAVVPGQIGSSRSVGCHDFINEFPGLVRVVARPHDIRELAGLGAQIQVTADGLGSLEKRALDTFNLRPIEAWEVQRLSGLTVRELRIALGSLETQGLISRSGTAYVRS